MAILGGTVGYRLLRWLAPPERYFACKDVRQRLQEHRDLADVFGPDVWHAVLDRCMIAPETGARADVVFSVCAFKDFAHPDQVLQTMAGRLIPEGQSEFVLEIPGGA